MDSPRNLSEVARLTGMDANRRATLARYYARMREGTRLIVYQIQTDIARRLRPQKKPGLEPEYFYAVHLLALARMHDAEYGDTLHRKQDGARQQVDRDRLLIDSIRANIKSRQPGKRYRVIEQHYELIERLRRDEGMTWRAVATYLASVTKKRISHSYIQQTYARITEDRVARSRSIQN